MWAIMLEAAKQMPVVVAQSRHQDSRGNVRLNRFECTFTIAPRQSFGRGAVNLDRVHLSLYRPRRVRIGWPGRTAVYWIARAMAESAIGLRRGFYGQPWFEKPALYYWQPQSEFA